RARADLHRAAPVPRLAQGQPARAARADRAQVRPTFGRRSGRAVKPLHVLVIGGTRFMGYHLVWRLLAGGHRVTVLNRGRTPDPFGARVGRIAGDRGLLKKLLAGRHFDAAVDFIAYTGDDVAQAVEALPGVAHYVLISTGQVYLVRENCPRPARESDY